MRAIPDKAVDFVAQWEGCELTAYQDVVGVWTIGYGSTGSHVTPGKRISQAEAKRLLKNDLGIAARRIETRIGDVVHELTESQYSALLSFVFNLGAGPGWTIWKVLKARKFDGVPAQLVRFNKAGGKVLRGLVRRRAAEVVLWNEGVEEVEEPMPSSGALRLMDTPPTPDAVKPLGQSKSFMTTGAAAVAALAAAAAPVIEASSKGLQGVLNALSPYVDRSDSVAQWVNYVTMGAAVLAVTALVLQWLKQRGAKQ